MLNAGLLERRGRQARARRQDQLVQIERQRNRFQDASGRIVQPVNSAILLDIPDPAAIGRGSEVAASSRELQNAGRRERIKVENHCICRFIGSADQCEYAATAGGSRVPAQQRESL